MKTPSSSFLQLPNGKQNNKPGPQLNKHATNTAELKCNRCCCSWTRLEAGSEPCWLAAAPGMLMLLQGFLCHTTASSLHQPLSPCSSVCLSLTLLLSVHPFCLSRPATPVHPVSPSLHHFHFLTLRLTGFILEKLKRRGRATSIHFLDHFSIGESNNYFLPSLFFLLRCGRSRKTPEIFAQLSQNKKLDQPEGLRTTAPQHSLRLEHPPTSVGWSRKAA